MSKIDDILKASIGKDLEIRCESAHGEPIAVAGTLHSVDNNTIQFKTLGEALTIINRNAMRILWLSIRGGIKR